MKIFISFRIRDKNDLVSEKLEMIRIEIDRPHCKPFIISARYRPPRSDSNVLNEYELFLFKCDIEYNEISNG